MSLMTQVGMEFIARDKSRAGMNSFNRGISRMTRSVLRLAGVGGGIYMLQRGLRNVITEASRAQETIGKFDVVFGDNARAAALWAEEFGNSVGRSTTDIQEWMASVQDLFVPLGFARDKATGLSESLVKLAVDVASFSNKMDADVIRDFTSALVGNHETVRKYGIMISENAIKQEALNQGLNKTYKELTDLEKVSIRMTLIQKGSTDAMGDAIRTGDSYANQIKRLKANYQELSVTIGSELIPLLSELIKKINSFAENGNFVASIHEIMASVYEFADSLTNLDELFKMFSSSPKWEHTYKELAGAHRLLAEEARARASLAELAPQLPQKQNVQWPDEGMSDEDLWLSQLDAAQAAGAEQVGIVERTNAQILADTREQLASVRSMHDKTRMEKIRMLEDYRDAHFGATKEIEAAEKLLNDEILAIRKSRVDAMKVYMAELREDMESSTLYIKEKFAEAAMSIEGSMSDAFYNMREKGADWRDAMGNFFTNVGDSFARMAADMLARWTMLQAMNIGSAGMGVGGSLIGGIGALLMHKGWVPEGVPSFQGGRGLKDNEMAAIIEKDELLVPDNKIIKSGVGGGMVINIDTYIERVEANDAASFDDQLYRSRETLGDIQIMNVRSNHPSGKIKR